MKPKLIKIAINRKIGAWVDEIRKTDKELAKLVESDVIVMGGAICSLLDNQVPNDFDIYFKTTETTKKVINFYYKQISGDPTTLKTIPYVDFTEREKGMECDDDAFMFEREDPKGISLFIRSSGILKVPGAVQDAASNYFEEIGEELAMSLFGKVDENAMASIDAEKDPEQSEDKKTPPFSATYVSDNAITLSDGIQIVTRFCGEPDHILNYYDFEHCKMFYDYGNRDLRISFNALEALHNKRLVYSGSRYPVCSLFRMRKFLERGFRINAGQIAKISFQIHDLELRDVNVLRDQLVGCDHAYFVVLLAQFEAAKIKQEKEGNTSFNFDNYLFELIDRMF